MKNRGQALIEFVMILPVIILILFGMIDLGNLFITKYQMINYLDQIIEHQTNPTVINQIVTENHLKLQINNLDDGIKYTIATHRDLITPGLSLVFKEPYNISVTRTIYE